MHFQRYRTGFDLPWDGSGVTDPLVVAELLASLTPLPPGTRRGPASGSVSHSVVTEGGAIRGGCGSGGKCLRPRRDDVHHGKIAPR